MNRIKLLCGVSAVSLMFFNSQPTFAMEGGRDTNTPSQGEEAPHPASIPPEGDSPHEYLLPELKPEVHGLKELSPAELAERSLASKDLKKVIDPILDLKFQEAIANDMKFDINQENDRKRLVAYLREAKAVSERNPSKPQLLSITLNDLTHESWEQLMDLINQEDQTLLHYIGGLSLREMKIMDLKDFLPELNKLTQLTDFNLRGNNISDAGAKNLAEMLKVNSTLQSLYLGGNHIDDAGVRDLAEMLKVNSTLQKLNLIGNNIGDAGAQVLAEMLKVNSTLKLLDLGGNDIGNQGAQDLAEALKKNSTLQSLYLGGNDFDDEGKKVLAEFGGRVKF